MLIKYSYFLRCRKTTILAVLFLMITRKGACIHLLKVFQFIDIGERLQRRIELPELFDRYIAGVYAADHRAKGIGLVILKVL